MRYQYNEADMIDKLEELTCNQLSNLFSHKADITRELIMEALEKTKKSNMASRDKRYWRGEVPTFDPYHSGQYAKYLWYLSNCIWKEEHDAEIAGLVYYLNKVLNIVDWYYEITPPEIFGVEHPLGCVLGRASYSSYLFLYQGTTIGGMYKGDSVQYPKLGEYITLNANASILGDAVVGDYVIVGANAIIKGGVIPSNCLVFGSSPNLSIIEKPHVIMRTYFADKWMEY